MFKLGDDDPDNDNVLNGLFIVDGYVKRCLKFWSSMVPIGVEVIFDIPTSIYFEFCQFFFNILLLCFANFLIFYYWFCVGGRYR